MATSEADGNGNLNASPRGNLVIKRHDEVGNPIVCRATCGDLFYERREEGVGLTVCLGRENTDGSGWFVYEFHKETPDTHGVQFTFSASRKGLLYKSVNWLPRVTFNAMRTWSTDAPTPFCGRNWPFDDVEDVRSTSYVVVDTSHVANWHNRRPIAVDELVSSMVNSSPGKDAQYSMIHNQTVIMYLQSHLDVHQFFDFLATTLPKDFEDLY